MSTLEDKQTDECIQLSMRQDPYTPYVDRLLSFCLTKLIAVQFTKDKRYLFSRDSGGERVLASSTWVPLIMANKMSSTEDILDTEDTIAMDLDTETQETNDEGTSRPATSIISDFSVPESIDDNDQDEEEDQDNEVNGGWIPASVHPNKALSDSYIHVSPRPSADGPFIVGVDEAGRGPALGPMVYGMAFCPEEFVDELKGIGFDGM